MNIAEIVTKVSNERQTPGRFPTRLIFAHNFADYLSLVGELKTVCDEVIDLSAFTKGDVLPRFKDFKNELSKHSEKQLLLLSLGEYLRICIKRERDKTTANFPSLWEQQQSEKSTTKYIIPIFGSREIFDSIMPIQDERQQQFVWEVNESSAESEYSLVIYSPDFTDAITVDATNLQEWFLKWTTLFSDKNRNSFSFQTKLYRYAEPTYGGVRLSIIDEPFAYVASLVADGEKLRKDDGNEEFWKHIAQNTKQGQPFAETIKFLLNIGHSFNPISVLARFNELSDIELNLLRLWYKLYPSDDYYTYAINKVASADEIPISLRDSIFELPKLTDSFIQQRTAVLRVLDLSYSDGYFVRLDKIPAPESRLMMLTYRTLAERAYAVRVVSGLLRSGAEINALVELLKSDYPDLAEYLNPDSTDTGAITQYFNWYRRSKLLNKPNTDIPCIIDFDSIDSRNKAIQQNSTDDTLQFWVDGLGAEWIPILLRRLNSLGIAVTVKPLIAKALLPTETEYNHKWTAADIKWDRLDKLSHNGMPDDKDYFLCIARQLEIMNEIVEHVSEMLSKVNRVIVTGDHGSSRLAALLFHDAENFAVEPPKDAIVHSFGRFVELKEESYVALTASMEHTEIDGKHYIVMKTYEHFKLSGNAAGGNTDEKAVAGEVHGGMTPEEYLVPVLVVTRKTPLPPKETIKKPKGITINDDILGLP
ncbi:MAG: hypothetical protein BWY11_00202 [Firmicutes bacterium ADurb.Bin182]|nr:MAG: hypothetical protein BWY11_00202 [Firmicutes bacterium ADurb.Bin182]